MKTICSLSVLPHLLISLALALIFLSETPIMHILIYFDGYSINSLSFFHSISMFLLFVPRNCFQRYVFKSTDPLFCFSLLLRFSRKFFQFSYCVLQLHSYYLALLVLSLCWNCHFIHKRFSWPWIVILNSQSDKPCKSISLVSF